MYPRQHMTQYYSAGKVLQNIHIMTLSLQSEKSMKFFFSFWVQEAGTRAFFAFYMPSNRLSNMNKNILMSILSFLSLLAYEDLKQQVHVDGNHMDVSVTDCYG